MRTEIFVAAVIASMLLASAAHAASDPASEKLLKSTSDHAAIGGLTFGSIAPVHTAAAFMLLVFLIGHLYLSTTGHTPLAHIKAMITGWEDEKTDESAAALIKQCGP